MLAATLKKFGYPETLVKEYKNWILLCRKKQVTLSSLILICKDEVTSFAEISSKSFSELHLIIKEVENNLGELFQYNKINYLMLMMVDPEVHFHIIPRYASDRKFNGILFRDASWPKKPDLDIINQIGDKTLKKLLEKLRSTF
jgi:diadenosine tetraphosphate (Ap4A) HIT family hydrolase